MEPICLNWTRVLVPCRRPAGLRRSRYLESLRWAMALTQEFSSIDVSFDMYNSIYMIFFFFNGFRYYTYP